jgi:hypothetical protein
MSEVDLYAVEAKFQDAKTEYVSIMNELKTCLGKESTKRCQKAAELNADMQTYLIQMSNLMKNTPTNIPKQRELLSVSNQLDADQGELLSNTAKLIDLGVMSEMNNIKALTWFISSIAIFSLIVYTWKK